MNKSFPIAPGAESTASVPAPSAPTKNRIAKPEKSLEDIHLGYEEASYILQNTLKKEHYEDDSVLLYISEYLRCGDSRQASDFAGIDRRKGASLKNRKDIYKAISALRDKSMMKYGFDAHELVEKVKEFVFADPVELENEDGSYKTRLSELSPECRRAIKKFKVKNLYDFDENGIKVKIGELVEVEMYDKMKAAEMLGREVDTFKSKTVVEHGVTENMKDILLESERRANDVAARARDVSGTIEGDIDE